MACSQLRAQEGGVTREHGSLVDSREFYFHDYGFLYMLDSILTVDPRTLSAATQAPRLAKIGAGQFSSARRVFGSRFASRPYADTLHNIILCYSNCRTRIALCFKPLATQ